MKTAIEFIQEAKEKDLEFLDLGNLGLTELPDELFELQNLRGLNLGTRYYQSGEWKHSANSGRQNIIKWIPWRIKRLSELKYLSMYATYSGDIHGLQGLPKLTHLDLSFNYQIRDFASLRFLGKLQYLSVNTTQIPDLSSITAFKHLRFLDFSYNWLKSFDNLKGFRKLSTLLLANALDDLIDLEYLRNLDNLSHLDLGANKVVNLKSLSGIKLECLGLFGAGIINVDFLVLLSEVKFGCLYYSNDQYLVVF